MRQNLNVVDLQNRIAALEVVIRDVEAQYSENWSWAERNWDVLKTVWSKDQVPTIPLLVKWEDEFLGSARRVAASQTAG